MQKQLIKDIFELIRILQRTLFWILNVNKSVRYEPNELCFVVNSRLVQHNLCRILEHFLLLFRIIAWFSAFCLQKASYSKCSKSLNLWLQYMLCQTFCALPKRSLLRSPRLRIKICIHLYCLFVLLGTAAFLVLPLFHIVLRFWILGYGAAFVSGSLEPVRCNLSVWPYVHDHMGSAYIFLKKHNVADIHIALSEAAGWEQQDK